MLSALWMAIAAGVCAVAASVAIYVLPELNLRISPQTVWFPLPTLFVATIVLMRIGNRMAPLSPQWRHPRVWIQVGALVLVVTVLGLLLSGWNRILDGTITLRGDEKAAPELFRAAFSVVVAVAGAFVEEATVRGLFQLRVRPIIGEALSHLGALIIFVALHGPAVTEPKRLLFLIVVGGASGYLASTTRSVLMPAVFHASVNVAIASVILALRP